MYSLNKQRKYMACGSYRQLPVITMRISAGLYWWAAYAAQPIAAFQRDTSALN